MIKGSQVNLIDKQFKQTIVDFQRINTQIKSAAENDVIYCTKDKCKNMIDSLRIFSFEDNYKQKIEESKSILISKNEEILRELETIDSNLATLSEQIDYKIENEELELLGNSLNYGFVYEVFSIVAAITVMMI